MNYKKYWWELSTLFFVHVERNSLQYTQLISIVLVIAFISKINILLKILILYGFETWNMWELTFLNIRPCARTIERNFPRRWTWLSDRTKQSPTVVVCVAKRQLAHWRPDTLSCLCKLSGNNTPRRNSPWFHLFVWLDNNLIHNIYEKKSSMYTNHD